MDFFIRSKASFPKDSFFTKTADKRKQAAGVRLNKIRIPSIAPAVCSMVLLPVAST
jgi:hypothetical protein